MIKKGDLEGPAEALPAVPQRTRPAHRQFVELPERMIGRGRSPQATQDLGALPQGQRLRSSNEGIARLTTLEQERPSGCVLGDQANGATTTPVQERVALMLALGFGVVQFENGGNPVGQRDPRDVGDRGRLVCLAQSERPCGDAFVDEPWQSLEPARAFRMPHPPAQTVRDAHATRIAASLASA